MQTHKELPTVLITTAAAFTIFDLQSITETTPTNMYTATVVRVFAFLLDDVCNYL